MVGMGLGVMREVRQRNYQKEGEVSRLRRGWQWQEILVGAVKGAVGVGAKTVGLKERQDVCVGLEEKRH
jgi:hypothetical protein